MEKVKSEFTGKEYDISKVVRILNLSQVHRYLSWHIYPIDMYPSIDYKTGKDIICFIFDRAETKNAYDSWCKGEKELKGENNGAST